MSLVLIEKAYMQDVTWCTSCLTGYFVVTGEGGAVQYWSVLYQGNLQSCRHSLLHFSEGTFSHSSCMTDNLSSLRLSAYAMNHSERDFALHPTDVCSLPGNFSLHISNGQQWDVGNTLQKWKSMYLHLKNFWFMFYLLSYYFFASFKV